MSYPGTLGWNFCHFGDPCLILTKSIGIPLEPFTVQTRTNRARIILNFDYYYSRVMGQPLATASSTIRELVLFMSSYISSIYGKYKHKIHSARKKTGEGSSSGLFGCSVKGHSNEAKVGENFLGPRLPYQTLNHSILWDEKCTFLDECLL